MKHVLIALVVAAAFCALSAWAIPLSPAPAPAVPPAVAGEIEGVPVDMTCKQLAEALAHAEYLAAFLAAEAADLKPCGDKDVSGCPAEWGLFNAATRMAEEFQEALYEFCPAA